MNRLSLKPNALIFKTIYASLADAKPLSSQEWNFIYQHQRTLSSYYFDPVLSYYLKNQNRFHSKSFLLPTEKLTKDSTKKLKKRLQLLLQTKPSINMQTTGRQLKHFGRLNAKSLIFYHGNQFLTGAPFQLGGVPHTIFFQWGNLFGVAKYQILPGERILSSNVMVHFELLKERKLEQAVSEYQSNHQPTNFFASPSDTPMSFPHQPHPTSFLQEKKSK